MSVACDQGSYDDIAERTAGNATLALQSRRAVIHQVRTMPNYCRAEDGHEVDSQQLGSAAGFGNGDNGRKAAWSSAMRSLNLPAFRLHPGHGRWARPHLPLEP